MTAAAVTVVIPAWNAADDLPACLDGVVAQEYPDLEILVVDDASTDATAEIAASRPRVRVLRSPENRGPAAARNRGIAAARGDVLVFLDADSIVRDRDWVARHATLHGGRAPLVVGGGVRGTGKSLVARADGYCHWCTNIPYGPARVTSLGDPGCARVTRHLVTNNMSVRRATLERIGPFDETFRTGEDVDFCERALRHGASLRLEPTLTVEHRDRERLAAFLRCFYLVGRDRVPLREKHASPLAWLRPRGVVSGLLLAAPVTAGLTLQTTLRWWPHDRRVALYAPWIVLGYGAMAAGMVSYVYARARRRRAERPATRPA